MQRRVIILIKRAPGKVNEPISLLYIKERNELAYTVAELRYFKPHQIFSIKMFIIHVY
jgi:hypothetical protein